MAKLSLASLEKAVASLEEALRVYSTSSLADDASEKVVLRDGVIQRFEFTFELCWKMLRRFLDAYGLGRVGMMTNKELFRAGSEQGLLEDAETWLYYLRMRNLTSHVYDQTKAAEVFQAARAFLADAIKLLALLRKRAT
ncbi:MAG: nucleotidyltransferase substrate binding protein [Nitrospirae bacterium]|nr:nucleotidyltransferase substrate binding protein [Nitrospirota bacterium]